MMNIVTTRTEGALVVSLSKTTSEVTYYVWYRETQAQQKAVTVGVKRVLKRIIKPGMDVYAKEFAINNYVVSHVRYDNSLTLATAYDALFKHDAVCNGYAWLSYDMLTTAGISTRVIVGSAHYGNQSGEHAWNEVDLSGKWYYLDTTWDTSLPNRYAFFNLTSAQLAHTHIWNRNGLPVANTNFVSVLQHSKNSQDKQILKAIEG
jgi:transglutaminase/protease-like cytokinesis protein 3